MNIFKNLEGLLKWLSSLLTCLVALSITRSFVFYNSFGIRITNYISLSESLLLFVDEIILFCWYAFLLTAGYLTLFIIQKRMIPALRITDFLLLNWHQSKIVKATSLAIFALPLLYLTFAFINFIYKFTTIGGFIGLTILVLLVIGAALLYLFRSGEKLATINKNFAGSFLLYLTFIYTICFYTSLLRRQLFLYHVNKLNQNVACYNTAGEKIIESTAAASIQYIGSTKEHIFFYNTALQKTSVYKTAAFDRIEFGKRNYAIIPGSSIFDVLY